LVVWLLWTPVFRLSARKLCFPLETPKSVYLWRRVAVLVYVLPSVFHGANWGLACSMTPRPHLSGLSRSPRRGHAYGCALSVWVVLAYIAEAGQVRLDGFPRGWFVGSLSRTFVCPELSDRKLRFPLETP
jgi:hypothetical protein